MGHGGATDFLPIWGVFLATVAVVLLSIEGGYRLGTYRRRRSEQEDRPLMDLDAVCGSPKLTPEP
jgi:hypothetical protein